MKGHPPLQLGKHAVQCNLHWSERHWLSATRMMEAAALGDAINREWPSHAVDGSLSSLYLRACDEITWLSAGHQNSVDLLNLVQGLTVSSNTVHATALAFEKNCTCIL
jgi:hypothetical protein